jgi:hypothetical protein
MGVVLFLSATAIEGRTLQDEAEKLSTEGSCGVTLSKSELHSIIGEEFSFEDGLGVSLEYSKTDVGAIVSKLMHFLLAAEKDKNEVRRLTAFFENSDPIPIASNISDHHHLNAFIEITNSLDKHASD